MSGYTREQFEQERDRYKEEVPFCVSLAQYLGVSPEQLRQYEPATDYMDIAVRGDQSCSLLVYPPLPLKEKS